MLKLVILGISIYLIWNLVKFFLLAHRAGKAFEEGINSKRFGEKEKDITHRSRIVDEDSKNDR